MRPILLTLVALSLLSAVARPTEPKPRLFQPPQRPVLPQVKAASRALNPIDTFILAKLEAKGLSLSPEADRLRLLRRVTFDLTGLPPTLAEQEAFVLDNTPGAYERVVERLLSSPSFGERQAQHWLDLVRYAETDGFKEDAVRPNAHRYRDWVIKAFNANTPYDRFIRLQLAGDEFEPKNPEALVAAGFNRLWPDEYNAANLEQRRQEILDDATDTTGLVFLGLTVGCARCHDHKFDPISQKDYFRLQAFFAPMQERNLPAADPATSREYARRLAAWEKASAPLREQAEKLLGKKRDEARADMLLRFNTDIQNAVRTDPAKRTPLQWQIALMCDKQLDRAAESAHTRMAAPQKKAYLDLQAQIAKLGPRPELPTAMTVTDIGRDAPPTHRLIGGDWRKPSKEVQPGFIEVLGDAKPDTTLPPGTTSTGRRAALARWLTQANHPLTARVMVNRLWQHHFGQGIVATPSDFGAQGTAPSHPELLDWLATELVASNWDLKQMHRLMVLSATYRQDSAVDPSRAVHATGLVKDRENTLLWHARRRRLEGEAIRDAMLAVSGDLHQSMFGVSARPELPAAFGKSGWKPNDDLRLRDRRSVYVFAKRNLRYPLFDAFDQPDLFNSCACRLSTTTAPQALILLNSSLTMQRARVWYESLARQHGSDSRAILATAYRTAWGRPASAAEMELGQRFVSRQQERYADEALDTPQATEKAFTDFCHALLNTNEFVTVD